MKKCQYILLFLFLLSMIGMENSNAQVTGLSDYVLFIDPGHSQNENMGLYNYSEAEKVLQVAHELKTMLETQTDIKEVHMSRLTDNDNISLSGRTDLANTLGADFYYSIHSDAGSPSANSTLSMYGGYNKDGVTLEKTPNGGKAFGDILCPDLTDVMRISTRGNYADRVYYKGNEATHPNQWPYLHVNRTTNMASLLSEGGFHTNPVQQQLNMNAQWKKMEALSAFRSFLQYKGIDRPDICIVAGIISDADTGLPVNGVTVTAGDKSYTTDTYASVFNKYSNDPEELRNGFYWMEEFIPNAESALSFASPDYQTLEKQVTPLSVPNGATHENITFVDVSIISTMPAKVVGVKALEGDFQTFIPGKDIELSFSRKMDRESVEQSLSVSPLVPLTLTWHDDFTLLIRPGDLAFETSYTIKLDGSIAKNILTQQFLDGDADGSAGGDYEFSIITAPQDMQAPVLVQQWPENAATIDEARPVLRFVFDEKLDETSISVNAIEVKNTSNAALISGTVDHCEVNGQSVLHFFLSEDLINDQSYEVTIKGGLYDAYGNTAEDATYQFTVNERNINSLTVIDDFDAGIVSWWQPQASGSTSGIVTEQTNRQHEQAVVVKSVNSMGSMNLNYGWLSLGSGYIREYLPPGSAQNANRFDTRHHLQMYVFGDGSGNKFRFMIKDGNSTYEASDWYVLNWIGWKLVSWDLTSGTSNAWVNGNGVLDGDGFYLDGIHIAAGTGGDQYGSLYFDDLRFVQLQPYVPTGISDAAEAQVQVYPNPADQFLYVKGDLEIKQVKMYTLSGRLVLSQQIEASQLQMNISQLSSGVYLLQLETKSGVISRKVQIAD